MQMFGMRFLVLAADVISDIPLDQVLFEDGTATSAAVTTGGSGPPLLF